MDMNGLWVLSGVACPISLQATFMRPLLVRARPRGRATRVRSVRGPLIASNFSLGETSTVRPRAGTSRTLSAASRPAAHLMLSQIVKGVVGVRANFRMAVHSSRYSPQAKCGSAYLAAFLAHGFFCAAGHQTIKRVQREGR